MSETPAASAAQSSLLAALSGVRHGFFGRQGGVSGGIYASLNTGQGSGDAPEAVAENRARIAAAFSLTPDRLLSAHQIHSADVVLADGPWDSERPKADAIVSRCPNLALGALAADCAPVLFADATARVVGAAHAGWRGAIGGVLERTVATMVRAGAAKSRIVAAVGPCIAQASYEVGPEFMERFLLDDAANMRFFVPGTGDRLQFDLKAFCAARLRAAGVAAVDVLADDTFTADEAFFSHRRSVKRGEPDYGRNLSVIALTK
jgi:polyphenol oxidase